MESTFLTKKEVYALIEYADDLFSESDLEKLKSTWTIISEEKSEGTRENHRWVELILRNNDTGLFYRGVYDHHLEERPLEFETGLKLKRVYPKEKIITVYEDWQ